MDTLPCPIGGLNIGFDANGNGMLRKLADDEIPEA